MGEWSKLTAEAAVLEKLVQVHRLQHRRAGYFARVLDVRRRVRVVLGPGKGASMAQVEQALHAIRAAWKDLQSLLIQTYFMPYALVHLALLSRLAALLTAHHAHLRSTLRLAPVAPVQTQPALLALCASTSSETALDRIFGGAAGASAPHGLPTPQRKTALQGSTAAAPLASQPAESSLPVASRSEDLGEPVPGEEDEDFGEPMPVEAVEPAEAEAEVEAEPLRCSRRRRPWPPAREPAESHLLSARPTRETPRPPPRHPRRRQLAASCAWPPAPPRPHQPRRSPHWPGQPPWPAAGSAPHSTAFPSRRPRSTARVSACACTWCTRSMSCGRPGRTPW